MGFGPLPGGLKPWNSSQTLFDGSKLYYSDGTTFVDSSGNVTLLAGTIDGMVIGGTTPEAGTFTTVGTSRIKIGINSSSDPAFLFDGGANGNLGFTQSNGYIYLAGGSGGGGYFRLNNGTLPTTPTAGPVSYANSGQWHIIDVNAVDINISLCPQPSAIYALTLDVGDPTQVIASTASLTTIQTSMNLVTAGSGDALFAVCQLMKSIQSGFNAGPAQYPVAS